MNKLITAIFLLSSAISFSQVSQQWASIYEGPDYADNARSIQVDAAGNVYVGGYSQGSGVGWDYCNIKYNSLGVQQWAVRYDSPGGLNDVQAAMTIDAAGNVYVTGQTGDGGNSNIATIKYNTNGVQQWVQIYNGPTNSADGGTSIAVDVSGNVYVSGLSQNSGSSYSYVTIKYNSAGLQQWASRYNGAGNTTDGAIKVIVDASGNVFVTGYSSAVPYNNDFYTIKYNSSGVQQWASRYNGPRHGDDIPRAMTNDASGNIYITGYSTDSNGLNRNFVTLKYNSAGDTQWVKIYDDSLHFEDRPSSIGVDAAGNVIVTGYTSYNASSQDFVTIKYSLTGSMQWIKIYNGPANGSDMSNALALDALGNIYITGGSARSNNGADFCTIKYDLDGVQKWEQRYSGPLGIGGAASYAIAVDDAGSVYVAGTTNNSTNGTVLVYGTVKYNQPIGIQQISAEIPKDYSLFQNYPNPFNPNSKIKFQINRTSNTRLLVFDLKGSEVCSLVNEQLKPGTYEVDFEGTKLASGVYFYELITDDFTDTKKMVLVK